MRFWTHISLSSDVSGKYVIVAAGNDLNRKLSFWVHTVEELNDDAMIVDDITNDLRRLEEDHLFDNNFDDVPSGFIEPQVSVLNYKLIHYDDL